MSEFGQIIDPYRAAPPQGGLLEEIMRFAGFAQEMDNRRRLELERMGTNQMINQNQGWSGVDPFKVQQFDQTGQQMRIVGAQENRTAQDWQQKQQFAQEYVPRSQGMLTGSPFLESFRGITPNPYVAQSIMGALGQRDQMGVEQQGKQQMLQQELAARQQMNAADNLAAQQRAESVSRINNEGELARLEKAKLLQSRQMKEAMSFVPKVVSGEMSLGELIVGQNMDANQAMMLRELVTEERTRQAAEKEKAANIANAQGGGVRALPMSQREADAQNQSIKDEEYNRRKGYWNFLEPKQNAMVYDKQGKPTAAGLQLLDQIKQQVLYNNAIKDYRHAQAGALGQAKIPYPSNNPNYPIDDWRRIIPQIVQMIEEANPR